LALCNEAVAEAGWRVSNLDCVVSAQRPKLGPLKETMRRRIAAILGVEPGQVNVKAKTGEHVGPVGRLEAIEAQAVVLLEPLDASSAD
ncbi:MAG: 2-C-methyl-D-erythritol 2,4-cyclodiphosphate synthase, partial [Thermoguttaceae bacterium]|nr:2-C-methyl-D-erythritol 2,4-cyclodiphosphate synthase [Thermoguttaceae bacterium]